MGTKTVSLRVQSKSAGPRSGLRFATLAAANSAAIAALYCNQTISRSMESSFPGTNVVSLIPTLTLVGYASGVALVASGRLPRGRSSVECHLGFLSIALTVATLAPDVLTLAAASFFVGVGAAAAPRLLAAAAQLVQPAAAGSAIGRIICGSLVAVLCVRLLGTGLADIAGWRSVFLIAAAIVAALALLVCATQGPRELQTTVAARPPTLLALWRSYPLLRRVSAQQAALFAAYNASWMTALLELPPHERPLVVIGGSCVGIAAALAAGHFSNRVGQQIMSRAGAASVLLAAVLVLPAAYGSASGARRALFLLAGMALVDAGLQVALVANQTRVQALAPGARSSLAATLTVAGFVGGSIGAGGGSWLWHAVGWQAAIGLVAVAGCLGFSCSFFTSAPKRTELRRFRELLQAVATPTSKLAIDALSACCQHARQSPTWPAASTQREADLRDCRAQPLRQSLFTHARNGRGRHRITRNVRELSPQRM